MKPIKEVIEAFRAYPEDALTIAYEGEANGITIYSKDGEYLGFIHLDGVPDVESTN